MILVLKCDAKVTVLMWSNLWQNYFYWLLCRRVNNQLIENPDHRFKLWLIRKKIKHEAPFTDHNTTLKASFDETISLNRVLTVNDELKSEVTLHHKSFSLFNQGWDLMLRAYIFQQELPDQLPLQLQLYCQTAGPGHCQHADPDWRLHLIRS